MAVRNVSAGLEAREAIVAMIPGARIDILELDLSSIASVRRFGSLNLRLNILINNVGVMTRNCTLSCDGLELHFATNHIGHFLQTNLLLPALMATAGVDGHGLVAIITVQVRPVASGWRRRGSWRFAACTSSWRSAMFPPASRPRRPSWPRSREPESAELDLSCMASVRRFAAEFESLNLPLNILINNAGVITKDSTPSHEGLGLHFATNHIENMKRTCKESGVEGRVVNVSSLAHLLSYSGGICFSKIRNPSGSNTFKGFMAYCQSKLANILHSSELSRILKDEGINISANAVYPGVIVTKNSKNMPIVHALMVSFGIIFGRSIEQGAATTCYVALHPQVKGISGKFFDNCNIAKPSSKASDAELAKKLWQFSLQIVCS